MRGTSRAGWAGTSAHAGKYLGELTWEEAERAFAETPIVVIPFGAGAKEHGPHLPMKTAIGGNFHQVSRVVYPLIVPRENYVAWEKTHLRSG